MKRLSDYKGRDGILIIGKLMAPTAEIMTNTKNKTAFDDGIAAFVSAMCQNTPDAVLKMLSVLSGEEDYECNGASVFRDVLYVLSDPAMQNLCGSQGEMQD